jgi:SAM-dependent methyltransferase
MIKEALLRQSTAFYGGEGDAWYDRNKDAVLNPIVVRELTGIKCDPQTIVEIGCSHGRYLNEMHKHYNCACIGYDPSLAAINVGKELYPSLDLRLGTARAFFGMPIDILVFGFCLYLVDRAELHSIVADADWCLRGGGYIVIHDFDPPAPQITPYHHKEGIFSYKMDYAALWLANPAYELVSKTETNEGQAITILRKGNWDRYS